MVNTREIALDALMEILEKKQYSHYVIKQVLDKYGYLEKQDRAFIKRITEGTIERCLELDYILGQFSKTPVKKMKPFIRTLLRMSVYQIFYVDSATDAAVCNEAVKLAQKRGFATLKGFVNGVLRSIARGKADISYPDEQTDFEQAMSIRYSMPQWIVTMWTSMYGQEKTKLILDSLLTERPLTIRFDENLSLEQQADLMRQFEDTKITLTPVEELAYAYYVSHMDRTDALPGFEDGQIMIQDAGSMHILEMAKVKEGEHIIDVCGAPGGKALHAACKLHHTGHVDVRDLTDRKVDLIEENIERSGYDNIEARVWDATVLHEPSKDAADLVIADLPCSGLGVIGRKSDIKYRVQPEDIKEIASLQRQILSTVCQYVKPGGRLIYSTCTLTAEENEQNAKWFAKKSGFRMVADRTLIPGEHGTDGFYMALFERV